MGAKDNRRARLLDAARQVFSQKGFHTATVDDITRVAGVAKGTFYLYFAEKPAIFYELMQSFFELVTEAGLSIAQEVSSRDEFFTRVEAGARRIAQLFRENRDLVRLAYRESMGMDERLEKMTRNFYRRLAEVEAENIRLGMRLGLFRADLDPMVVAYAHIGMIERVLLQWQFDRSFPPVEDLEMQLVQLAYFGLKQKKNA